MGRIEESMASEALGLREASPSNVRASDDYVQTLALILGYDDKNRIPLRCSPSGVIATASPYLADVVHLTGVGANDAIQGDSVVCTELLVMAHPDNADKIWVRTRKAATVNNALPLDGGDIVGFTVANLRELHGLVVADGDKLIVGYTV